MITEVKIFKEIVLIKDITEDGDKLKTNSVYRFENGFEKINQEIIHTAYRGDFNDGKHDNVTELIYQLFKKYEEKITKNELLYHDVWHDLWRDKNSIFRYLVKESDDRITITAGNSGDQITIFTKSVTVDDSTGLVKYKDGGCLGKFHKNKDGSYTDPYFDWSYTGTEEDFLKIANQSNNKVLNKRSDIKIIESVVKSTIDSVEDSIVKKLKKKGIVIDNPYLYISSSYDFRFYLNGKPEWVSPRLKNQDED